MENISLKVYKKCRWRLMTPDSSTSTYGEGLHGQSVYIAVVLIYCNITFNFHLQMMFIFDFYDLTGFPISRMFIAPSLTPRRSSSGLNNPGVRLYKIEIDTGQVIFTMIWEYA